MKRCKEMYFNLFIRSELYHLIKIYKQNIYEAAICINVVCIEQNTKMKLCLFNLNLMIDEIDIIYV